jgi:hypothetical protein
MSTIPLSYPAVPLPPSKALSYTHHYHDQSSSTGMHPGDIELRPIPTHASERSTEGLSRANTRFTTSENASLVQVRSQSAQYDQHRDVPDNLKEYRRIGLVQFAALCGSIFLEGWNDGSTGPLLPRFQSFYHVSRISPSLFSIYFHQHV